MRNKYSKKFEKEMFKKAKYLTLNQLLEIASKKYNYLITKNQLRQYLYKRNIIYKDYSIAKKRNMGDIVPIGVERIKSDGMVQVKISPRKWEYKQRLIYQQYYGVELTSDDYIIFLDQDRTNFNISNLKRVSRRESSILSNQKLFSKKSEITELGLNVAKLIIKLKDKGRINYE